LETADTRARHLEDTTRRHWDALRAETERHWEQLRQAERQHNDRIRKLEGTLHTLHTRLALFERFTEIEDAIAAVHGESHPNWTA
jgi:hypothetical protein